jgi:hypothetical protein
MAIWDKAKHLIDKLPIKVLRWSDLSIEELLSIRRTLKSNGEDLTLMDKELKSRIVLK